MKKTFEIKGIDLISLYGISDQNITFIEQYLPVNIDIRGDNLFCKGLKKDIEDFSVVLSHMIESVKKGNNISTKDIKQLLAMNIKDLNAKNNIDDVLFYGKKGPVYARSIGQKNLLKAFFENEIIISVGPAGTGKTFLAVAYAISLLEKHEIEKIVLNMGIGDAKEHKNWLTSGVEELTTIAGQKAVITISKKAISNFKIREGDPVGIRVTLRGNKMYEYLDRFISVASPRIRDFRGLSAKGFDGRGNYNFGVTEQIIFPEIDYDKINNIRGLNISIVTTGETDEEAYELLVALGLPIRQKKKKIEEGAEA